VPALQVIFCARRKHIRSRRTPYRTADDQDRMHRQKEVQQPNKQRQNTEHTPYTSSTSLAKRLYVSMIGVPWPAALACHLIVSKSSSSAGGRVFHLHISWVSKSSVVVISHAKVLWSDPVVRSSLAMTASLTLCATCLEPTTRSIVVGSCQSLSGLQNLVIEIELRGASEIREG